MRQDTINRIRKFTEDRDWDQFHTPANLAKSIAIEASELLECFQWSDTEYDLEHVSEELADVLVYCRNMLDKLGLDEDEIINRKMEQNERNFWTAVLGVFLFGALIGFMAGIAISIFA